MIATRVSERPLNHDDSMYLAVSTCSGYVFMVLRDLLLAGNGCLRDTCDWLHAAGIASTWGARFGAGRRLAGPDCADEHALHHNLYSLEAAAQPL